MYLAGLPYHVVQRGNNRQACFFDDDDRRLYLELLVSSLRRYDALLHAFVLMTNHVHLLLTPRAEDSISRVMRVAGSCYAQRFNRKYARTGSLWEGRHKASVIEADAYLLCCYRYIEMNPVRAGMVTSPDAYRWSSYRANACGGSLSALDPHPTYAALGSTPAVRQAAYRALFAAADTGADDQSIRRATSACVPLGDEAFSARVARQAGQVLAYPRRGRPARRCIG